jgi:hypothetical protein
MKSCVSVGRLKDDVGCAEDDVHPGLLLLKETDKSTYPRLSKIQLNVQGLVTMSNSL